MDNHGKDEVEGVWWVMNDLNSRAHPQIPHMLYIRHLGGEQGFYPLPTDNRSSYYDYLYIHTSSYANNLSISPQSRG